MIGYQTIYDKWTNDFRKILFCIGIVLFGTIYNFNEPKAFAVAVMVQGASNIDGFWEYLDSGQIGLPLKILSAILIFFSAMAMFFAFFCMAKSIGFCAEISAEHIRVDMLFLTVAVSFPLVPWVVDIMMNVKKGKLASERGGDVEL